MNFTNSTDHVPRGPPPTPLWYWVISFIIVTLTIVGNGTVIFLIITRRCLDITNNYFILSLATADISTGIFVIPSMYLCEQLKTCNFQIAYVFINTIFFASVANVCSMTLDRYISIVIPLKYFMYMTKKRVMTIICLSWVIPFIVNVIPLTYSKADPAIELEAKRIYDPIQIVVFVILPIVLMLIVYARIYVIAKKIARQTNQTQNQLRYNDSNSNNSPERTKKERREKRNREGSVAVIGAVIILFALCWALAVYNFTCTVFKICKAPYDSFITARLLIHLNSSINPIVYAVLKKDIRRELRKALHSCRQSSDDRFDRNNSSYSFATSTKLDVTNSGL